MIVVVGGHSRNIGKTSVVTNLIEALPQYWWTAVKITQFGHGVCAADGAECECSTDADHPFALTRERDSASGSDTSRYLAAGASEAYWLRTRVGELGFGIAALRRLMEKAPNVILESNSVLRFIRPDLYLVVLRPETADFKDSSRIYLDRADAFLLSGEGSAQWDTVAPRLLSGRPAFTLHTGYKLPAEALALVEARRTKQIPELTLKEC